MRYSPEVRRQLDAQMVKRAVIAGFVVGLVIVASEWNHRFWPALGVFLGWQIICAAGGRFVNGRLERWMPNALFFAINVTFAVAFGWVTQWSVAGLMFVPFVVAAYETFGEGDTRPFILAKLAVCAVAMAIAGVELSWAASTLVVSLAIHWLSDGRSLTLRAALAGLEDEMKARLQIETDLRQAQKLESVGRLASGVAHELNTPVQYVRDSMDFLEDGLEAMKKLVHTYRAGGSAKALKAAEEEADFEYLVENLPSAVERSSDGLDRIINILRSMKEFAHPDGPERAPVDLNRAIASTLTIASSEYRLVADVQTDYGELPSVLCHAGEVNQAVLNVVVNAAHAISDVVKQTGGRGVIRVSTRCVGDRAVIAISDTGGGIPDAIRDRIFDPFFTTKEVGRGTGQGLAIARSVLSRHGGDISFQSELGRGTTFEIQLPLGV